MPLSKHSEEPVRMGKWRQRDTREWHGLDTIAQEIAIQRGA
jgi:hypothetical protein